jgi:hypothetical protein
MPRPADDDRIEKVREELQREQETIEPSSGDPERPDLPMGPPPDEDAEEELPGFPKDDPSHG